MTLPRISLRLYQLAYKSAQGLTLLSLPSTIFLLFIAARNNPNQLLIFTLLAIIGLELLILFAIRRPSYSFSRIIIALAVIFSFYSLYSGLISLDPISLLVSIVASASFTIILVESTRPIPKSPSS